MLDHRVQVLDLAPDRVRRRVAALSPAAAVVVVDSELLRQQRGQVLCPRVERTMLERAADQDYRRTLTQSVEPDRGAVLGFQCAHGDSPIECRLSGLRATLPPVVDATGEFGV
jgi:hypothetical protein